MPGTTESRGRLGRLAWFFAIAAVSAVAVAVAAEGLRFLILH